MKKGKKGVMNVTTKIQKWGNSFGIRIPKEFIEELNLKQGSEIELRKIDDILQIIPKKRKPTLEELMAKITPENQHDEIDWGTPQGKEVW